MTLTKRLESLGETLSPDDLWETVLSQRWERLEERAWRQDLVPWIRRVVRSNPVFPPADYVSLLSGSQPPGRESNIVHHVDECKLLDLWRESTSTHTRGESTKEFREAFKDYVETVKSLDIVSEIRLQATEEGWTVWTVIDSPAFEFVLQTPVYQLQGEFRLGLASGTPVEFRVVNTRELGDDGRLEDMVPQSAEVVWCRSR